ncbi:hypothetical protein K0M31_013357 [Melipona bicolor]|uniref:Uncharacterized protein n=1 Tax=Melipona bicolor TaxID=60889 RepID=A0AA40FI70_9HYME|nr:hypothetical protein K0M31_013357 [Melipona bicolor]
MGILRRRDETRSADPAKGKRGPCFRDRPWEPAFARDRVDLLRQEGKRRDGIPFVSDSPEDKLGRWSSPRVFEDTLWRSIWTFPFAREEIQSVADAEVSEIEERGEIGDRWRHKVIFRGKSEERVIYTARTNKTRSVTIYIERGKIQNQIPPASCSEWPSPRGPCRPVRPWLQVDTSTPLP